MHHSHEKEPQEVSVAQDAVRAFVREHGELELVEDREHVSQLPPPRTIWGGRWVSCTDDDIGEVLDDILVPGIFLTRDLDRIYLVVKPLGSVERIAVRGAADQLIELVEEFPQLEFEIQPIERNWRVRRRSPTAVRVEGNLSTRFYPWQHMRLALFAGAVVASVMLWFLWLVAGPGSYFGPWGWVQPAPVFVFVVLPVLVVSWRCRSGLARMSEAESTGSGAVMRRAFQLSCSKAVLVVVGLFFAVYLLIAMY